LLLSFDGSRFTKARVIVLPVAVTCILNRPPALLTRNELIVAGQAQRLTVDEDFDGADASESTGRHIAHPESEIVDSSRSQVTASPTRVNAGRYRTIDFL
jgi:enhancing lycopene biosynthesis protein 2